MPKISSHYLIILVGIFIITYFTWYFYRNANDFAVAFVDACKSIKNPQGYCFPYLSVISYAYDSAFKKIVVANSLVVIFLAVIWHFVIPFFKNKKQPRLSDKQSDM